MFLLLFGLALAIRGSSETITLLNQLPLDENNRLDSHWLLYSDNDACESQMRLSWDSGVPSEFRKLARVGGEAARAFFGDNQGPKDCHGVCLELGTLDSHVVHPLPMHRFPNAESKNLVEWLKEECQAVEVGFVNNAPNDAIMFWINHAGSRVNVGNLGRGEKLSNWQTTYLGHQFQIVDSRTGEIYKNFTARHSGWNVIGPVGFTKVHEADKSAEIKHTLSNEWLRSKRVTRTFTELGFDKGRLPDDLWSSMSSYYYNNRNNKVREEWENKGMFVNWWEHDAYMIGMPWGLKRYWQSRLKHLVEAWSGVELELTDIYGMRRYEEGARLLSHVDREATHAASLIINIAQSEMRTPWKVEIYDFAYRLHEIEMDEGDIVYYESAKCLHGRMKQLEGAFYVNLFAHYRPIGDDKWFLRENPPATPAQLLDIGQCKVTEEGNSTDCTGATKTSIPFLSPELEVLKGPDDLFNRWRSHIPPSKRAMYGIRDEL